MAKKMDYKKRRNYKQKICELALKKQEMKRAGKKRGSRKLYEVVMDLKILRKIQIFIKKN